MLTFLKRKKGDDSEERLESEEDGEKDDEDRKNEGSDGDEDEKTTSGDKGIPFCNLSQITYFTESVLYFF